MIELTTNGLSFAGYFLTDGNRIWSKKTKRLLKVFLDKDGYPSVGLCVNGTGYICRLHVVICAIRNGPKPFPKAQVRHLDGNDQNNDPRNLCWGTAKEDAQDRIRHGTIHVASGERSHRAKHTDAQVRAIYIDWLNCAKDKSWGSYSKIAKRHNVDRKLVGRIVAKLSWWHITDEIDKEYKDVVFSQKDSK
jgi:hypothetical protein